VTGLDREAQGIGSCVPPNHLLHLTGAPYNVKTIKQLFKKLIEASSDYQIMRRNLVSQGTVGIPSDQPDRAYSHMDAGLVDDDGTSDINRVITMTAFA
jgi:hypothetical protein